MLARMAQDFPDFDPVSRMIEQAERVRDGVMADEAAREKAIAEGLPPDQIPPPVDDERRNLLSSMYERPAKYLVPRLKEMQLEVAAGEGSSFNVTIVRPAGK